MANSGREHTEQLNSRYVGTYMSVPSAFFLMAEAAPGRVLATP